MPKLISLNIEQSKHLDRNIPFLQKEKPDVLCLQEVFEADKEKIASDLAMPYFIWLKDTLIDKPSNSTGKPGFSGVAIYSRTPIYDTGNEYYHMPVGGITLEIGSAEKRQEMDARGVIWASTDIVGERYVFVNTHFTWSESGSAKQCSDFDKLKKILERLSPHILTGDLNAKRGLGLWEKFVEYYGKDNIPSDVTTTIDPMLHRAKNIESVVDGIFSLPPYVVSDVQVVSGVSDHQAIVAHISKRDA